MERGANRNIALSQLLGLQFLKAKFKILEQVPSLQEVVWILAVTHCGSDVVTKLESNGDTESFPVWFKLFRREVSVDARTPLSRLHHVVRRERKAQ